jgi:acetyl esterase/lipase
MRYLIVIFFGVFLFSCKKDDDAGPVIDDTHYDPVINYRPESLVSSELLASYEQAELVEMAEREQLGDLKFFIRYGVQVFKIEYYTTLQGREITASALMILPEKTTPSLVVSTHHGTIFSHAEAPTVYSNVNNQNGQSTELLGGLGFITLVPDYIGFGSSENEVHPYYNEQASADAVRDGLIAVQDYLILNTVHYTGSLCLMGYSEGGYVTMAAAKAIEQNPINGLTLKSSAAGSGGYNIPNTMEVILQDTIYRSPNYFGYVLWSYENTLDASVEVGNYFQEPYASQVPSLYDGSNDGTIINNALTDNLNELLIPEKFLGLQDQSDAVLLPAIAENSVDDWVPVSPLRLYHGDADEVVPVEDSRATLQKMEDAGGNVEYFEYGGKTHGTTFDEMLNNVIPWFLNQT